jgi:hypothetical protein
VDFRLDRLDEVIQAWWLGGWARRSPGSPAGHGDGRRFARQLEALGFTVTLPPAA